MKATVHLADPEESHRIEVDARDRRAFERDGRAALGLAPGGSVKSAAEQSPERYIAYLAWSALRRAGLTGGLAFGGWEASRLVEIVPDEEETGEAPDPTRPAL